MSELLITMILAFCPGEDFDSKGQVITNACQERMTNCMISKAGLSEPTKEEFNQCANELRVKYGSSAKVQASGIEE